MDNVAVMMRLLVWGAVLTALVAGWAPAQTAAAVAVDGTVNDGAGLAVAGAIVTLETAAGAEPTTTTTDQAGAFHCGDVAAGSYNVTVAAGGFAVWTANVTFGVLNQAPVAAVLRGAPVASTIEVPRPPKELAAEQLKSEVKQRLLGIFPHFLVTYEPNAAPLTAGQKEEVKYPQKPLLQKKVRKYAQQPLLHFRLQLHFLVTYEPNAAPLTAGQKFHLG